MVFRVVLIVWENIQWVYVAAVKDAVAEQRDAKDTALSKLLFRRVHSRIDLKTPIENIKQNALGQYQTFLDENRSGLDEVATSLSARFQRWAHQNAKINLDWIRGEKAISVAPPAAEIKATEGRFAGELARFGHGLQRSFIFALLEELAQHAETGPLLILGCEEPELYQHPPQARYMASVLERLSQQNSQVLICTHSPYFVSGRGFESIRIVLKDQGTGCSSVKQTTFEDVANMIAAATGKKPDRTGGVAAKVEQEMQGQMNEMFFAYLRIFVEGLEDLAYISSYISLMDRADDFRALGCHIIQVQGKNHLIEALAISQQLGLPLFTVFDADGDTPADTAEKSTGKRKQHENENTAIFNLHHLKDVPAFPDATLWTDNLVAWPTKIGDIVKTEFGEDNWQKIMQVVRAKYNNFCPDMAKNALFLGYMMSEAWEQGVKSPSLIELCERILKYARSQELGPPESDQAPAATTVAVG